MTRAIDSSVGKRGIVKPFASPGGKEAWRGLILQRIPAHKIYVEPYAGSATIFFAKTERAELEVLSDKNPDIVSTYVFLRDGADGDFAWMRKQDWAWDPTTFSRLQKMTPKTRRERVYRFKYLNLFSRRGAGEVLNVTDNARKTTGAVFLRNLEKFRERLEGVKIFEADAIEVMARFDSADTFHYVDPPWKPVGAGAEWRDFDVEAFSAAIKGLQGKALVSFQGVLDLPDPWRKVTVASALGGVGTTSKQEIHINFEPPVAKYCGTNDPSGTHSHDFDRKALSTGVREWSTDPSSEPAKFNAIPSGMHSHLFVINDMVVMTECDGSHLHKLETEDANVTALDGQHSHRLPTLTEPLETTVDGAHQHALGVTYSSYDGGHTHELVIEGVTHRSLLPGEFWALFVRDQDPAAKNFVPVQKPFANEHRARQADPETFETFRRGKPEGWPDGIEAIFGIGADEHTDVQSIVFDASMWSEEEAKTWLQENNFSADGFEPASSTEKLYPKKGRAFKARVHQHFVGADHFIAVRMRCDDRALGWSLMTQRAPIDASQQATTKASIIGDRFSYGLLGSVCAQKGAPDAGTAMLLDELVVEYGLQHTNDREYFFTCGKSYSGVLRLRATTSELGEPSWSATLSKSARPAVLSPTATATRSMPPEGTSALPSTIEKMVPPAMRYWLFKGEEARLARDALAASDLIGEMRLVDGEFRLVQTKVFVQPYPEFSTQLSAPAKPIASHERIAKMATWPTKPVVIEASMAESVGPDDLVATLTKSARDFIVMWPDTAHARAVLSDLGQVFTLKHGSEGLLFVISQPLQHLDGVEMIAAEPVQRFVVQSDTTLRKIAKLYDQVSKREIPIFLKKNVGEEQQEERFVLGVVLEPETVDAQKDIYSADEIRKAAHGYMEFHGNRGLMHKEIVNDRIVILESYVAPVEFSVVQPKGTTKVVKAGTWLLGYGIRDAEIWKAIRTGKLNGLSIGGSAVRRPRSD